MAQSDQRIPSPDSVACLTDLDQDVLATANDHTLEPIPKAEGPCVRCEVREGVPVVRGHAWSYYLSCGDGTLMLVLGRRNGERIRVSSAMDVVILEVHGRQVKLGLRCAAQSPHRTKD